MARKITTSKVQSEQHNTRHDHSAQDVANAFVEQYYKILSHFPEHCYKFYREESIISLPGVNGVRSATTIKGIDEEIMNSEIKNSSVDLLSVHAQDTVAESVIAVVVGLLRKDCASKCFSQTFLLAPQARGFYVQNDFFQFIDAANLNALQDTVKDKSISETENSELPNESKTMNAPQSAQSFSDAQDNVKILSYASIVAKANLLPTSNAPCEDLEKDQNHESSSTNDVTHIEDEEIEKKDLSYASIVAKEISLTIPQLATGQVLSDRSSTDVPAKPSIAAQIDKTIYIRDLPPHVTRRTLTHAVKRFGSVKHRNIQIRGYPDGYRYAFVEFNNLKAARLAVEAGFIKFDDWECEVESKKAHLEGL